MTAFDLAQRYVGIAELSGEKNHPLIQWWLSLCGFGTDAPDEVPWCSAFVNGIAWELRLPRSKSAAARSWLEVGRPVLANDEQIGFDVAVLSRGNTPTQGHVGFFGGLKDGSVYVLGGNQNNSVSVEKFAASRILEIRRLSPTV